MNINITKNYLALLQENLSSQAQSSIVAEIAMLLADANAVGSRVMWLEALSEAANRDNLNELILNPLGSAEASFIVRESLQGAWVAGILSFEDILRIPHSISALEQITEKLFLAEESEIHPSWKKAFELLGDHTIEDHYSGAINHSLDILETAQDSSRAKREIQKANRKLSLIIFRNVAAASFIIIFILYAIFTWLPKNQGDGVLTAQFILSGEKSETNYQILEKIWRQFSVMPAYAGPNIGFTALGSKYIEYQGEYGVSQSLSILIINSDGRTLSRSVTDENGNVTFDGLAEGSYALYYDGVSGSYTIPVTVSESTVNLVKVVNYPGTDMGYGENVEWMFDAKTIHDSNNDGWPDDGYSFEVKRRPVNSDSGGIVIWHSGHETRIDTNGNGSFEDPNDLYFVEPDADGIPSDAGDGDEDDDGVLDNADPDIDNDGVPNSEDQDIDGDGLLNNDPREAWPYGITDRDDLTPPTLQDGSEYSGISDVRIVDQDTDIGSINVFFPVATDEESNRITYKIYISPSEWIDYNHLPGKKGYYLGHEIIDGNYSETITGLDTGSTYYIAVRTWNNATPPVMDANTKTICLTPEMWGMPADPEPVIVAEPQTQIAGSPIHFHAENSRTTGTTDITEFWWDWDSDGVYDEEGIEVVHAWHDPSNYQVQLRVTTSDGLSADLSSPFTVMIVDEGWGSQVSHYPVISWGSPADDSCNDIAIDNEDNIFAVGWFFYGVDFDSSSGISERNAGNNWDCFLVKYSADYRFQWVKTWGGYGDDEAVALDIDSYGNIYIAGRFQDTVDFDPGLGTVIAGNEDSSHNSFLTKFNKDGEFQWVRAWGEDGYDCAASIVVDSDDNIIVAGFHELLIDDSELTPPDHDIGLYKFDGDGSTIWSIDLASHPQGDQALSLAVDSEDNIFVTGYLGGAVQIETLEGYGWISTNSSRDAFLIKLSPDGVINWIRTWGGFDTDFGTDIAVDSSNTIYITGTFSGTLAFNPPSTDEIFNSSGANDAFILAFDEAGNIIGGKTWGGQGSDNALLEIDGIDSIFIAGHFSNDVPESNDLPICLPSNVHTDFYLMKQNSLSSPIWMRKWGGILNDLVYDIELLGDGRIALCGTYSGQMDFNPTDESFILTSAGRRDSFILILNENGELADY